MSRSWSVNIVRHSEPAGEESYAKRCRQDVLHLLVRFLDVRNSRNRPINEDRFA